VVELRARLVKEVVALGVAVMRQPDQGKMERLTLVVAVVEQGATAVGLVVTAGLVWLSSPCQREAVSHSLVV